MSSISIFFLGGGHGGIAALRSLQSKFGCIEIISSDADARAMARPSDRLCDDLESVTASCGVMAGYLGMLSGAFLAHRTVLNVHYSLLPRYRGLHSVVWAILNMEPEMGLTIHLVNEEMDDGPILYQYQVPYAGETSWELMEQFNKHISGKLGDVLEGVLVGQIHPSQQDKGLATWVPRRNLNDCLVDFSWPVNRLRALFRALVRPYPLPALRVIGQRYEIPDARFVEAAYFCDLGRVVNVDKEGAWIKCADSLLVVPRLLDAFGVEHAAAAVLRCGQRLTPSLS